MTTATTTLRRLRSIAGPAPLNAPGLVTVDGDTWTAAINRAGGVAVRSRLARDSEHWRTTFEIIAEYGTQYTTTVSDILTCGYAAEHHDDVECVCSKCHHDRERDRKVAADRLPLPRRVTQ